VTVNTCTLALIDANLGLVNHYCGYDVLASQLPSRVYKLAENRLLLSNTSQATVRCHGLHNGTVITPDELQVVLQLDCDCDMTAAINHISFVRGFCHAHLNITEMLKPWYALNLTVLAYFFDAHE